MKPGANRRDHELIFQTFVPLMLPGCLHVPGNVLSEGNQTRSVAEMMWKIVQTKLTALKVASV